MQKENAMLARPGTPFPSGPENGDESLLLSQSRASQVRLPAQARSLLCGTCSRPADPRCGGWAFYAAICWHPCCLVVRLAGPRTAGSGMFGGNGPRIYNSSATLKPDCSMRLSGGNRAIGRIFVRHRSCIVPLDKPPAIPYLQLKSQQLQSCRL